MLIHMHMQWAPEATEFKKGCFRCKWCNQIKSRIARLKGHGDADFKADYQRLPKETRIQFNKDLAFKTDTIYRRGVCL